MMNLMEYKPESVLVAQDVPPIEEECSDKPSYEALRKWHVPRGEFEQRDAKYPNPESCRRQRDSKLDEIYQQCTPVIAFRLG
jgi:hypothetical protein